MSAPTHIAWFEEIGLDDRAQVGGKGGSLGELTRAGISVPPGYVLRTAGFECFLSALEREAPVRAAVSALAHDDLDAITACSRALRARIEQGALPEEVLTELVAAHERLVGTDSGLPLAVRSSATCEDAADASFAGLQDTYLWVRGLEEMVRRVRSCWASLYSVESISYRLKHRFPEAQVAMAVVVQVMVDAGTSGVMFTRSPTTGDRSVVTIEGAWGVGSAVVGGEVTPDRWVLGKITGEISVRDISDKHVQHVAAAAGGVEAVPVSEERRRVPCLTDDELQRLRELARRIERHYGRAQDIEWAIDRASGAIRLLQSRPETVWSSKDTASVATPQQDPLMHVLSIFGKNQCR